MEKKKLNVIAEDLNEVLGLDPAISKSQTAEKMLVKIKEAVQQLIRQGVYPQKLWG